MLISCLGSYILPYFEFLLYIYLMFAAAHNLLHDVYLGLEMVICVCVCVCEVLVV